MNQPNRFMLLLLILSTSIYVGCGAEADPKKPVKGTVTLDGEPLPQGSINFTPADGQGPSAGAQITNGSYSTSVLPGKMKVSIESIRETPSKNGPKDPHAGPTRRQILPAKYNVNSQLTADIPEDGSDSTDFQLTSK